MPLTNKDVSARLEEIATLLRLAGENEFKAIAFDRAARTIETLNEDIDRLVAEGRLTDIKGIGTSIALDIKAYRDSGSIPVLDALKAKIPAGLIRWLDISGLGPKKIHKIHTALGITTLDELKTACRDGSVAALDGLGAKSAEKILKSIEWMEQFSERCRLDEASEVAEGMVALLKNLNGVEALSVAGSLRRSLETIGDIDILIGADPDHAPVLFDVFTAHPSVTEILGRGDTKSSVRTQTGRQVDLRIVKPEQFPAALMYFTGSKEHNVVMRQRARDRGMALNEYGLFRLSDSGDTDFNQPVPYTSEEDIYRQLGLGWIPPELREDRGEFEWIEGHSAADLLSEEHIRGVVHAHSTWSDGTYSIREMAEACMDKGYSYLGITDHSRTAAYAGGLDTHRVMQQWAEIDALNAAFAKDGKDFRVLKGIESDIVPSGDLDYPAEVLAGFDFVIGSVHASIEMDPVKMLDRYKRAAENRYCSIIGHPTTRLLLRRDGNAFDMNALIRHAAACGTAIEINASPWRLDMDWRYGRLARECGLMTSVNPDAHDTSGIDDIRYGVGIARKAGFGAEHVLNTLTADAFLKRIRK